MAAGGSLEINKEGEQELKDPLHRTIFYHQKCEQDELEDYDHGHDEERSVEISVEIQGNSPLLHKKGITRKSSMKRTIKKWLKKKKVLRTGAQTEANVPVMEVNASFEEAYDKGKGEMEQLQPGENQVEEEITKSINSNSKELLFNEEIDFSEDEIECYTVQFGTENMSQDEKIYPSEVNMAHHPKENLLEKVKDDTSPWKKDPLAYDTEVSMQESPLFTIQETRKETDEEQEERSVKHNFAHKKNDSVTSEVTKAADEQQEEDVLRVLDKQKNGVPSFDHMVTGEGDSDKQLVHKELSTSAEQKGTDEHHNKRLIIFTLLSLLLVYIYISTSL